MNRKKKVLFFGLGSIGRRHLRILQNNFDYKIYAYRSTRNNPIEGIKNIYNIEKALQIKADIAFITNPTHLHIQTALNCLDSGIKNLFIEKPLSHNLNNIKELERKGKENNALIYIGYSMRFNPVLIRLKELIDELKERIIYSFTTCQSYLPKWRSGRDYRNFYSSKKDQGGGVILDLIHEFDYNEWLFGKIKTIKGQYGKISALEIDSEDFCDVNIKFENDINGFIHLDYFSHYNQRKISVLTAQKELIANLINNEILIVNDEEIKKENFKFEIDYMYEQQLKDFLDAVEIGDKEFGNLKEAGELLQKLIVFKNNNKMIIKSDYL
ncbi:MAG: Gfo/Idh/MocA family protein [Promethearchaeota archaeon]